MIDTLSSSSLSKRLSTAFVEVLLVLAILAGAVYLRLNGLYWGEYQYLHPDERFLIWVGADIQPVDNWSQYFDTANSSLNPNNRGHGFYVYGTFPMFLTRYVADFAFEGMVGWVEITQVGRLLSALADLTTVLLVFLIGKRLFGRWGGLLAMAFSAVAVLQIQQSHFFTMDTFTTLFSTLALYFAVIIATNPNEASIGWPSVWFGVALGMAVASKINTAPVAAMLPVAMVIFWLRLPREERDRSILKLLMWLGAAAVISLLVFRLLQPYAFSGPGFFGLKPNPLWVENIRTQRAQASRDVDFPPAMQWARRPVWFSAQNMVMWGLGLPLGLLAWAGFLWAGWRMITGWKTNRTEFYRHALIWLWTGGYFVWQSLQINPTMRYQLPIYPTLEVFAAWALVALFQTAYRRAYPPAGAEVLEDGLVSEPKPRRWLQVAAVMAGGAVLLTTAGYAYAFTQIYSRPITRIAATRWIYENIPGPINLRIQTADGFENQILPIAYDTRLTAERPYAVSFLSKFAGTLDEVNLPRVWDDGQNPATTTLRLSVFGTDIGQKPLATGELHADFDPGGQDPKGKPYTIALDQSVALEAGKSYAVMLEVIGANTPAFSGNFAVTIFPDETSTDPARDQMLTPLPGATVQPLISQRFELKSELAGWLSLLRLQGVDSANIPQALSITVEPASGVGQPMQSALVYQEMTPVGEALFALQSPPQLNRGETYYVTIDMRPLGTSIALRGLGVANEGDWDDALPLRMENYDGFGGVYPLDLNFNMYWEDTPEKLDRFLRILNEADYIVMSSNRQWGSLPRIPERFPMTTLYYRSLLGCPNDFAVDTCYKIARPGMFQGQLGYELIDVFTSEPKLGPLSLNDQFAEEAFSVYDHPKVMIFKKTEAYNPQRTLSILSSVDFSSVIRVPPLRAGSAPATLMLPEDRWAAQQQGGTWSRLFNTQAWQNRSQILSVMIWYLTITLLGWLAYPLLRLAAPGLNDRGYPLARITGMLVFSYVIWLGGSIRIPVTREWTVFVLFVLAVLSAYLYYRQRDEIRVELRTRRSYFLVVEGLFLAFFLAFLLVRIGNPDLWHPWKGGERPMDFSYFNAVLKSATFPPYDPWYAGGYLNYYYYGFVLVGMPVKLLGIVPAVAYNLILPTLFSMIAMGAFSAVWNLVQFAAPKTGAASKTGEPFDENERPAGGISPYIPAIAGALGMAVLGNLGTVRMVYQGFQRLAAPNGDITNAGLLKLWVWGIRGFARVLGGERLPYSIGDWYWIPSRAIPAPGDVEPITEFPYFSVLYGDPHAHLIALPLTLLALGLIIGFVLGRGRWRSAGGALAWFGLTGLAIGVLRPTNTWDMPTYLALGIVALLYTGLRYILLPDRLVERWPALYQIPAGLQRLAIGLAGSVVLIGLAFLLFRPFAEWYALAYTKVAIWHGVTTPAYSYLIHWGLFLFAMVSWMTWETIDWMASTPVSALRNLSPYWTLLKILAVGFVSTVISLVAFADLYIAWIVLPLGIWAVALLLRRDQPDAKRIVLFLFGTGLVLTLMVELIVLVGDVGRMNTVFKFYLQVWTLFAIGAAAGLGWALPWIRRWRPEWQLAWQAGLTALVFGAFLFTFMATLAKMEDRMAEDAPHTLDGMAYMPHAIYVDEWGAMDLSQDYDAIRWLQENVQGSPVIVEANLRNLYRWGSRMTIYTGLPGVVGWEWHQQQQRAVIPGLWITQRIMEIDNFYLTTDLGEAQQFLQKYNVRYIIVGLQERGHYSGPGLEKFEDADGALWREVYRERETVIYEVTDQLGLNP